MSWLPTAAAVLSISGNLQAGASAKRAALAQQAAANWEVEQMRVNAGQALASSQLEAQEERRQGEYVQSRAMALLAAQGGSMTDPSAIALLSRNAGETAYRSSVALYKGKEAARELEMQGGATIASGASLAEYGRNFQKAKSFAALSDVMTLAGTSNLFKRFGDNGPKQG